MKDLEFEKGDQMFLKVTHFKGISRFHVSMLRKYNSDPYHILVHEPLSLHENLSYEEILVGIMERKTKVLRNQKISFVKIRWQNHTHTETT